MNVTESLADRISASLSFYDKQKTDAQPHGSNGGVSADRRSNSSRHRHHSQYSYQQQQPQHEQASPSQQQAQMADPFAKCRVLYLGSAIPLETSVGLEAIQKPLDERYPANKQVNGIDSTLTVFNSGLQLQYRADRSLMTWFPIQNLYVCAAVRCIHIQNAVTGEVTARFVSLDSPAANDPNARHPPMFACIIRRTTGKKTLECHAFICKSSQSAMALVRSCMDAYENKSGWMDSIPSADILQNGGFDESASSSQLRVNTSTPLQANHLNAMRDSPRSVDTSGTGRLGTAPPSSSGQGSLFDEHRDISRPYSLQFTRNHAEAKQAPLPHGTLPNGGLPVDGQVGFTGLEPQTANGPRVPTGVMLPPGLQPMLVRAGYRQPRARSLPPQGYYYGMPPAAPRGVIPALGTLPYEAQPNYYPPVERQLVPVYRRVFVPVKPAHVRLPRTRRALMHMLGQPPPPVEKHHTHSLGRPRDWSKTRSEFGAALRSLASPRNRPRSRATSEGGFSLRRRRNRNQGHNEQDGSSDTAGDQATARRSRRDRFEAQMRDEYTIPNGYMLHPQYGTIPTYSRGMDDSMERSQTLQSNKKQQKKLVKQEKKSRRKKGGSSGGDRGSVVSNQSDTASEVFMRPRKDSRVFPRDWYNEEGRRLPNERAFSNSIRNQRERVQEPDGFPTAYDINVTELMNASTGKGSHRQKGRNAELKKVATPSPQYNNIGALLDSR